MFLLENIGFKSFSLFLVWKYVKYVFLAVFLAYDRTYTVLVTFLGAHMFYGGLCAQMYVWIVSKGPVVLFMRGLFLNKRLDVLLGGCVNSSVSNMVL